MLFFDDLSPIDIQDKKICIRADLNVPLENGAILNDRRIIAMIPTLKRAVASRARVIVLSHLGRPQEGLYEERYSLLPIAQCLSQHLNQVVHLQKEWLSGVSVEPAQIVLCENTRFQSGEKSNDPALATRIAALADIFVMDAFGVAHRSHASTVGAIEKAPLAVAGPLLCAELAAVQKVIQGVHRPFVAVMGGAKIADKLPLLNYLLDRVDVLILGGGLANTFMVAEGRAIHDSLFEVDQVPVAKALLAKAQERGIQVLLPEDFVMDHQKIFDIGQKSARRFAEVLMNAATIVWNGPMGVFEDPRFVLGTEQVARAIAASQGFSIAGGGETLAAIDRYQLADHFSHISTGGGAFLACLSGQPLAAVEALNARIEQRAVH